MPLLSGLDKFVVSDQAKKLKTVNKLMKKKLKERKFNKCVDAENDRRHGPCGASPAPSGHFRSRQALNQLKKKTNGYRCSSVKIDVFLQKNV
jgi:hypothetical protein